MPTFFSFLNKSISYTSIERLVNVVVAVNNKYFFRHFIFLNYFHYLYLSKKKYQHQHPKDIADTTHENSCSLKSAMMPKTIIIIPKVLLVIFKTIDKVYRLIIMFSYPYVMEKKTLHLHAGLYKELQSRLKRRCDD